MAQSRRTVLKVSIALAAAAPAAAAASGDDAELIRLCAEFDTLERRVQALNYGLPDGSQAAKDEDARHDRLSDRQGELLDRICGLPCTTVAGVYALGNTLALYVTEEELDDVSGDYVDSRLQAALLRGITGKRLTA